MIVQWLTFFGLLLIMWLVWDPLGDVLIAALDQMLVRYPGALDPGTVAFIRGVEQWLPFFVLLGGLLYILVASQRSTVEGYM